MLPSLFAASAALLSLAGLVHGIPQASTAILPSSSTVSQAAAATGTVSAGTACNNSPDLCNRNYNNITHMGAHDSAFLRDSSTSFATAGNQFYNATIALSAGIRLLQAQVHNLNGNLELCHSSCNLLDGGTLESWLSSVKTWMDANPNEVVTILLVNSDNEDASLFGSAYTSSGISKYGYTPPSTSAPIATWPTLQTLISANTRLITFIASITYDTTYPYLLPEFTFVFETAFGVTDLSAFVCSPDRPTGLTSSSAISQGYMGLINHFKDTEEGFSITVPDVANLTITNSPETNTTGALGLHGANCKSEWAVRPTFILVDFFNVGPTMETADSLNGIVATGRTAVSEAELSQSSSDGVRDKGFASFGKSAAVGMGVLALVNFVWL